MNVLENLLILNPVEYRNETAYSFSCLESIIKDETIKAHILRRTRQLWEDTMFLYRLKYSGKTDINNIIRFDFANIVDSPDIAFMLNEEADYLRELSDKFDSSPPEFPRSS